MLVTRPVNKSDQGSWPLVFLVYAIGVLGASTISQAVTVARDISGLFHAPHLTGWIISTPSALVAVGALLTGWLVDRIGDKSILIVGCFIVVIGDIGATWASSIESFLAMRVVEGIGYVAIAVSAVTMLMRITSGPQRTIALTLWSTFIPMSFALPLLLTARLAGTGNWRWAFTGHAMVLGVLALIALVSLPARYGDRGPRRTTGLATVLRSPGPYLLGLAFAAGAFVQTGIVSTLANTLTENYGVSFPVASSIGTLGMLANTAGALVIGPLLNRGVKPMAIASVGVIGMVLFGVLSGIELFDFTVAVIVSSVFFFSAGLIVGLWALLPQVAPGRESMGATSGLVTQLTLLGVFLGPPAAFVAIASDDWAPQALNVLVAGLAVLVLVWLVVTKFSSTRVGPNAGVPSH